MNSFRSSLDKGDGRRPSGPLMPGKKPSGGTRTKGLSGVSVTRESARSANHRDDDRHRLQAEHATLKVKRKNHRVELINLSGGGAMVRSDAELDMWQKVFLRLGDCSPIECSVRWIRGDRIGLEFAHETQIVADADRRNAVLLEVLKRSFPESSVAMAPASQPESAFATPEPATAEPTGEQRRTELRHPLIWWGEIHFNHDTTRVRLRNISEQGALVDSDVAFAGDAEVLLDLGGAGQHFATVTWSRGDQVGLRFTTSFDIALLAKVKPEIATHQWVRPSYLKSGRQSDADSRRGWQTSTVTELRDELEGFLKH